LWLENIAVFITTGCPRVVSRYAFVLCRKLLVCTAVHHCREALFIVICPVDCLDQDVLVN
jgi:hypothetical protein